MSINTAQDYESTVESQVKNNLAQGSLATLDDLCPVFQRWAFSTRVISAAKKRYTTEGAVARNFEVDSADRLLYKHVDWFALKDLGVTKVLKKTIPDFISSDKYWKTAGWDEIKSSGVWWMRAVRILFAPWIYRRKFGSKVYSVRRFIHRVLCP